MISTIRLNRMRSSKLNPSRFILNHSNSKQRTSSSSNLDSLCYSHKNNTFHYSTQTDTSNLTPTLHGFISNLNSNPSTSSTSTLTLNLRIQSLRSHSKLTFLTLTDGSLPNNQHGIQAVISGKDSFNRLPQGVVVGSTVSLSGNLQQRHNRKGEKVWEFKVDSEREGSIRLIATSDNSTYPFPLTNQLSSTTTTSNLSPSLARTLPHLRPRISRHSSLLRIRHRIEQGLENWFSRNEFIKCYPPILTTGDCEGAGEVFQVVKAVDEDTTTTIDERSTISQDSKSQSIANSNDGNTPSTFFNQKTYLTVSTQLHLEALSQGLGRVWTSSPVFRAEGSMTNRHLAEFWMVEAEWNVGAIRSKEEEQDRDQTEENGKGKETSQQIFEERKMLDELLDGTEKLLKSTMKLVLGLEEENTDRNLDVDQRKRLEKSRNEIKYLHETSTIENDINSTASSSSSSLETLESYTKTSQSWPRISYTEAIKILNQVSKEIEDSSIDFSPPKWGESLSSSQEKYLSTNHFKSPLFVYDYPISIKPFYMRGNSIRIKPTDLNLSTSKFHDEQSLLDDGRTVSSFDLLIPGIGELVGGSVREERKDRIRNRMLELGLIKDLNSDFEKGEEGEEIGNQLDWYSKDLRNYGPFQTVGFGIGVERLLAWLTRTENIRDCTTWIRTRGNIKG